MSKAAERAARVEAAKQAAYLKKVRTLVGYVGPRVTLADAVLAKTSGLTAEAYAFSLAAAEPVGRAVFAVKAHAVEQAEKNARERVSEMTKRLEAANWNLDVLAPRAVSSDSREAYRRKSAIRQEYASIVERTGNPYAHHREPFICAVSPERVEKYVAAAARAARCHALRALFAEPARLDRGFVVRFAKMIAAEAVVALGTKQ